MRYYEDIEVGEKCSLGTVCVKEEEMKEFASKYNRNFLHTDEEYMKNSRFGSIIAPGMYTFSLPWATFQDMEFFERGEIGGMKTTIEWYKGVYAGDELTSDARITEKRKWDPTKGIVVVEISTYNQKGKLVLKSTNELLLRRRKCK